MSFYQIIRSSVPIRKAFAAVVQSASLAWWVASGALAAESYLDNQTQYSNQDPNTETRRSEHFRMNFGHYNRDSFAPMNEQMAQGNLQMYEQMWNRWVVDMGLHDINESATTPDGNKYRTNFNFLMTWDDNGGGGAYSSMDANGFFYAMANISYTQFDPPSGATPHEMGHVWEGSCGGFNGTTNSGSWWECTANWMLLQFLNTYPQTSEYLKNTMYYPAHGRDYYDTWVIYEAAREDPRYGAAWVNSIWTNATTEQKTNEYILDRMIRLDASGSADKASGMKDMWGTMARKMVTWDFERKQWLSLANKPDDGSDWEFYQRCRTPLVRVAGSSDWYRPSRGHLPMEYGFNIIPLAATASSTVSCNFRPQCDPVRQSDWRACLVAVDSTGAASYSSMWNTGVNSITLSADQSKLYLVVIATPKPMKIPDPAWQAYLTDAGLQFPYAVAFTNASPKNVVYPAQSRTGMVQHANGGGWKSTTATVDASAYIGLDAQVLGSARVTGNARIDEYAVVKDNAVVGDNAVVSGHALVEENAQVYGHAKVRDWGHVFGSVEIYENGRVIEHGNCGLGDATTHTRVYGNAVIKGTTYVYNGSTFNGGLIMDGDSANGNDATPSSKGVHFGWGWGADLARFASLPDNNYLFARHSFEKDNAVFAMDEFGINHGFAVNGCRIAMDGGTSVRGGRVLPLDGVNQYVELHHSINDFKDSAYAVWCKPSGGASDQRVWSFGNGSNNVMYLTPNASGTGALRFVISNGTTTETLDGPVLPLNTWKHLAVVFSGVTCTLYVDGVAVASNGLMSLFPESLNAHLMENSNYLGRGNTGNYFQGSLDDFRCYMRSLSGAEVLGVFTEAAPAAVTETADVTAPSPDSATWLVAPISCGENSVTMSATPGTDASGWVEYDFTCVSGGGHDSGWVSFNKYTDIGLTPGSTVGYTVKMRDRAGNTTAASSTAIATLGTSSAGSAGFAYGPVGIANGQITMTAVARNNASGKAEYKFDCTSPTSASSGWQASPVWVQTGLTTGTSYAYTVTVRDASGHTSDPSSPMTAMARDDAAPSLPITPAHWKMMPYPTIDNRISMTAQAGSDPSGVEYYFHCVSGGGPDSSWQSSNTYVTSVLADGSYVYQYKIRDKSARNNESTYSSIYTAKITPTTGYHACTVAQAVAAADDNLVTFPATVMRVGSDHYEVRDLAGGAGIIVKPNTRGLVTDPLLALKNVTVSGHLYTFGGVRVATLASVTAAGDPTLYTVSGKVTNASGGGVAGATVCFSDSANASANAIVTAITDAGGYYARSVTSGTWYVVVTSAAYNTSADQSLTVTSSNVSGLNFTLKDNANVAGTLTRSTDGSPISGAEVYFSRAPGASSNPAFTAVTDANGNYVQPVQDGIWYVSGGGSGYFGSPDKIITVSGLPVLGIGFVLESASRDIPQISNLLFSAVTENLPASGGIDSWSTYLPSGQAMTGMGYPVSQVETVNGTKWAVNSYASSSGFLQGTYSAPISVSGATIVVVVKPKRNTIGTSWTSIVDVFYNRLAIGIRNNTGKVDIWRNGTLASSSTVIADGQETVLSLVVQPTGQYTVFANGVQIMENTSTSDMTSLVPNVPGVYANKINIGRNNPDGWSVFNGSIGDVFVYKVALSDAERQQLEADLTAKFISSDRVITATAGSGGFINPMGAVGVLSGGSQSFSITPLAGYVISDVKIDGVSHGTIGAYTFSNVVADRSISATFVMGSDTAPSISDVADQSTNANTSTGAIPFTISDTETAAALLTVSGSSSNTTLVPNANIVFGGSDANRTVTVTPASDQSGSAIITLTVSDGSLTVTDTFVLTVNAPLNTAPTISDVADQSTNEDASSAAIPFTIGDLETAPASLTVSGSSSNTTLVSNANIVFGGSGTSRTVTVTPASNQYGTSTITLTVTDGDSLTATDTFVLTVNPVNDAPIISDVASQSIPKNTSTSAIPFTVGDVDNAPGSLTVTASSSNTAVVLNSGMTLGGSGANRTVTVTPVTDATGTATITLTVSDGTRTASDTFDLTVTSTVVPVSYTWNQPGSPTVYSWITPANWTANSKYPNGTNHTAVLNTSSGDLIVTLDAPITLGGISSATGTLNIAPGISGGFLTFDNGNGVLDTINFNAPLKYRLYLSADLVLNDNLNLTYSSASNSSAPYIQGVVSGAGGLTVNYSSSATLSLGATGGAANTHQGGTTLAGVSALRNISVAKANVVGSGALSLDRISLQIATFAQTFAGLNGGANSAVLIASGTPAVTLNGSGSYAYSGVIAGGISLAKSGTGTQVLSGTNTYTGATTVMGGSLLVNGSLATGSAVTVGASGTLGGTGAINGAITNSGTIAPGSGGIGALTAGVVTLSAGSKAQIEFSNWTGSTPGTHWDTVNCASLALSGTTGSKITLKLEPSSLANFSEASKTFTIATSATAITGFAANAIAIDSTLMPGAGTWAAQLDATGKLLQVVYTASAGYTSWQGEKFTPEQISAGLAAADADPDHDGYSNLAEFAFNGDPLSASSKALVVTERKDTGADGKKELVLTCAVRRGAVFSVNGNNAQVSAAIDGIVYRIEATADLGGAWNSAVTPVGSASNTPPAGSGLPVLTTGWEYRTFSSFNGLPNSGFMRAVATQP